MLPIPYTLPTQRHGHKNPFSTVSPPPGFEDSRLAYFSNTYEAIKEVQIGDNNDSRACLPENKYTARELLVYKDKVLTALATMGRQLDQRGVIKIGEELVREMQHMNLVVADCKLKDHAYNECIVYLRNLQPPLLFVYEVLRNAAANNVANVRELPWEVMAELNRTAHKIVRGLNAIDNFTRAHPDIVRDTVPGLTVLHAIGVSSCTDLYDFGIFVRRHIPPPPSITRAPKCAGGKGHTHIIHM